MTKENTQLAKLNNLFGGTLAESMGQATNDLVESASLSKSSTFLLRLQLFSGGKAVKKKLIEEGNFGIPKSADEVVDLGASVDVLPIWRKPKAIDMSDPENLIISNDVNSEEFKRIVDMADNTKDSGCAYGPTYLVYERSTGEFYEFFAGNASGRVESSKINTYLPVTPEMIEKGLTDETKPRFAKPMTLKSQYVEKGKFAWYAPKAEDCLTPFDKLPTQEQIAEQLERFRKKEDSGVETVKPEQAEGRSSRAR